LDTGEVFQVLCMVMDNLVIKSENL
jgi:hypothetical protein